MKEISKTKSVEFSINKGPKRPIEEINKIRLDCIDPQNINLEQMF